MTEEKRWRPTVFPGLERTPECYAQAMHLCERISTMEDAVIFEDKNKPLLFSVILSMDGGWAFEGLHWIAENLTNARIASDGNLFISTYITEIGTKTVNVPIPPLATLYALACQPRLSSSDLSKRLSPSFKAGPAYLITRFIKLQKELGYKAPISLDDFFRMYEC